MCSEETRKFYNFTYVNKMTTTDILLTVLLLASEALPVLTKSRYSGFVQSFMVTLMSMGVISKKAVYSAELITHNDLDGDGVVGTPDP